MYLVQCTGKHYVNISSCFPFQINDFQSPTMIQGDKETKAYVCPLFPSSILFDPLHRHKTQKKRHYCESLYVTCRVQALVIPPSILGQ